MATLTLVATPIGNLADLSPRAIEALRTAALVCCEDTRRTGRLLQHAGVTAPRLAVVNDHTEAERVPGVLDVLARGGDVALVTDAGTPGISDPGERLVRAAIAAGHQVTAVPGPAAVVMALAISGLPTSRFVFEGFLPRSGSARAARLAEIAAEVRTVVAYEAPHRIARTVADLARACGGDRPVVLARELTKLHEEVWRGTVAQAVEHLAAQPPRGEYVVVVGGAPPAEPSTDATVLTALERARRAGATTRDAVDQVSAQLGIPRRRVYQLSLEGGADGERRPGSHPGAEPATP